MGEFLLEAVPDTPSDHESKRLASVVALGAHPPPSRVKTAWNILCWQKCVGRNPGAGLALQVQVVLLKGGRSRGSENGG